MNMNNEKRIDVITCFGDINDLLVSRLIDVSGQAINYKSSEIHLHISSRGGDLHAGFAAYHHLRSLNIPLIAHNIGNVESAAVLLFLAADTRLAAPHATFLLHPFHWTYAAGGYRTGVLQENFESLEFDINRYAEIFDERTQKGFDIRDCLSGGALRMSAASAFDAGIITSPASAPNAPQGAIRWWALAC